MMGSKLLILEDSFCEKVEALGSLSSFQHPLIQFYFVIVSVVTRRPPRNLLHKLIIDELS